MGTSKVSVYDIVTERIITVLESGTVPWQKPWRSNGLDIPRNAVSNRPYHGINVLLLGWAGFDDLRFLTYNQAKARGTSVRKGEKGHTIVFWSFIPDKTNPEKSVPILRYYTVFNVSQVEDIDALKLVAPVAVNTNWVPIDEAQAIADAYPSGPSVTHNGGDRAYYRRSTDSISIPLVSSFTSADEYYSTLFHELTHSTGHESRLDRLEDNAGFGCESYAKEELVAELGSAFLCAHAGIDNTIANSAAYIAGWLRALKSDPRLIVSAAGQAQKAATLILNETAVETVEEAA